MIDPIEPMRLFESPESPAHLRSLLVRAHEDVPSITEQARLVERAIREGAGRGSGTGLERASLRWTARAARHATKVVSALTVAGVGAGALYMASAEHRPTETPRPLPLAERVARSSVPAGPSIVAMPKAESPPGLAPVADAPSGAALVEERSVAEAPAAVRHEAPGSHHVARSHAHRGGPVSLAGTVAAHESAGKLAARQDGAQAEGGHEPPARSAPVPAGVTATDDASAAAPGPGEASLLRAARQALPTSPARTLALAEEHLRRYPHGILDQEREALRIEALVALGRMDDAEARAQAFAAAYPNSPHRGRIAHALARGGRATPAP